MKLKKNENLNTKKWTFIIILIFISLFLNYFKFLGLKKNIIVFILNFTSLIIFLFTEEYKKIIKFIKESLIEIKKVKWPSNLEVFYTSCIIIIIIIFVGIILWIMDSILFKVISFITNLGL